MYKQIPMQNLTPMHKAVVQRLGFKEEVFNYLNNELGDNPKIRLLRPRTQVYVPGSKRKCPFCCMQFNTLFDDVIGDMDIVVLHIKKHPPHNSKL
jgi:hypothetical protein